MSSARPAPDQMTIEHLGREAVVATGAVHDAVCLVRSLQERAIVEAFTKADASPVTAIDFAIQALIVARLARESPHDAVIAEEDASRLRNESSGTVVRQVVGIVQRLIPDAHATQVLNWIHAGGGQPGLRFWTLDPIDGTRGLLGGRQYAIVLALIVDGVVQVGVIGCPRLSLISAAETQAIDRGFAGGGIAVAVREKGAWWIPAGHNRLVQLAVSSGRAVSAARALTSYERQHGDAERFDRAIGALGSKVPPVLMDSQAKHVALASGAADLLLRFPPQRDFHDAMWDCAAGSLLIAEAGGRVTDLEGRALDFTAGRRLLRNEGFLGSNGLLHDAALLAIRGTA
jgi:3'(2'), 5'-bisphosphate nucleotidase